MAVTIYTKVSCPYCAKAILALKERNVDFTEINVTLNPDKIEEMVKLSGSRKVPVLVDNGQVTVGYNGGG